MDLSEPFAGETPILTNRWANIPGFVWDEEAGSWVEAEV